MEVQINVEDPTVNGTCSGIKSVTYEVWGDGNQTQKETLFMDNGTTNQQTFSDIITVDEDAAGNSLTAEEIRVLITTNLMIQYYQNKPLFYGSIIGAIVLIGGTGFIVFFAKTKKKET